MRKLSIAAFFTLLITLFAPLFTVFADYTPPFEVSAEAVYVVNLDTDTVVYQKNADKKMYPASLTKLMTTILAFENTPDLDNTMVRCGAAVWDEFIGINISSAGILPGEERSMRDLIYCMLLPSANEAASIVASYVGGNRSDFVAMMNDKAQALGAVSTHYVNPHGLDDEDQYTTAQDMYLIARYAMQLPGFMDIATSNSYTLVASNKRGQQYINTTNHMQEQGSDYYYQYIKGLKTGTTDEAGRCFVSTATKNGYTYLIVLLGEPLYDASGERLAENKAFADTRKLYDWAFDSFEVKELLSIEQPVTEVALKLNWDKDYMRLRAENEFSALVPKAVGEGDVIQRFNVPPSVNAPVAKDDVIGTVELMVMGARVGSVNLLAEEDAARSDVLYWFEIVKAAAKTVWFYIGITLLVLLLIVMIIGSVVSGRRSRRPKFGSKRY
ncbi:MAG: D-alanyl-D-alanine carboxypeptidase family protein [Acetanaerobacterium sp.]